MQDCARNACLRETHFLQRLASGKLACPTSNGSVARVYLMAEGHFHGRDESSYDNYKNLRTNGSLCFVVVVNGSGKRTEQLKHEVQQAQNDKDC